MSVPTNFNSAVHGYPTEALSVSSVEKLSQFVDHEDLDLFDWFPASPASAQQQNFNPEALNPLPTVTDAEAKVNSPSRPVLSYVSPKTVLPAETRPQMQKKVSVVLKNYPHSSVPILRIGATCAGAANALREATAHVRASVEIRKTKDDSWVSATAPPASLCNFSRVKGEWTWSCYFQFTHVSLFQDSRKPSTGPLTLSFYASSKDMEEVCLLKSDPILVQAKPKAGSRRSSRRNSRNNTFMEEKEPPQPSASLSPQQSFREINSVPTAETAWGTHSPGSRHSKVTESKTTEFYNKNLSEVGDAELGQVLKRRYQTNDLNSVRIEEIMSKLDNKSPPPSVKKRRGHDGGGVHTHNDGSGNDDEGFRSGSSSPTDSNSSLSSREGSSSSAHTTLTTPAATSTSTSTSAPTSTPTLTTSTTSKKPLGLTSCERHLLSKFAQETFPFIQELISYCKMGNFHPRKAELVGKFLPIALEKIAGAAADAEQDFENASITSKTLHKYLKARGKSSSNYLFIANKLRRAKLVTPEEMYKWKEEMQALNSRKGIEKNDSACPIEDLLQNLEEMRLQPGEERCTMNEQETAEKGIQRGDPAKF
ncbi:hypothetical protein TrST_g6443 [Triparma strigata]|uniref:Uncharacterized protein n=1 Tax=Triparma strigata TaxID=1606541 RepID=A0A9W7DYM5_9STRA|nr:hypothetical protein TrST_g6443 [Triparma strigata]